MIRLVFYEALTQMIIFLGWWRERLRTNNQRREDRVLYAFFQKPDGRGNERGVEISCCDCGLVHYIWLDDLYENLELSNPVRPERYGYRLRLFGGGKASFFEGYNSLRDYLMRRRKAQW